MGSHASLYAVDLVPEDVRQVMDELRRIVRSLRLSSAEAEKSAGVSGAQLFLLHRLRERPARSIAELAERTLTDQSSVSAVLAKLEARGFIRKKRSAADARKSEIELTARGRHAVDRAPLAAQARLVEALVAQPGLERRTLARLLGKLAEAMGAGMEPASLFFEEESSKARSKREP